uniref:Phylloseptin-H10 n=1 Tax=Pithecopus hypochondrialis TaxID=317381 RepID=PLS10_PITHY|nr:RecName: Full=Phylloseptin-H10; Short=PLS-H10; AltName: Full=Phylloseptin-12; Short=PS-12 [Pithecopus hypochondrialis]
FLSLIPHAINAVSALVHHF